MSMAAPPFVRRGNLTFKYSKKIDSIDIGGFTIAQWKSQREILKSDLNYSNEWEKAVDWYDNRLKVRYFDPMARIEKRFFILR